MLKRVWTSKTILADAPTFSARNADLQRESIAQAGATRLTSSIWSATKTAHWCTCLGDYLLYAVLALVAIGLALLPLALLSGLWAGLTARKHREKARDIDRLLQDDLRSAGPYR